MPRARSALDSAIAPPILRLGGLSHAYTEADGTAKLTILEDASLSLEAGEMVALVAPSGTGKSTLLHLAGLMERPSHGGTITINGYETSSLGDAQRTALRRQTIGFVYQSHHLLPEFTASENIALPQMADGVSLTQATQRANELLAAVGLTARAHHLPSQLSGGEQQRVAIARALANNPLLLLADEPTGNLDTVTAASVFDLLRCLTRDRGTAALIATHNPDLAAQMDRIITLRDQKIVDITAKARR
jgi:lipoprotein-releasing system ATP-binding protein